MIPQSPMPALHQNQSQYRHLADETNGSFSRPANTPPSTTMCSGQWDETATTDALADVPNPWKRLLTLNHLLFPYPKQWNPDPATPVLSPLAARNAMRRTSNDTAPNTPAPTAGQPPLDIGLTDVQRKRSKNIGGKETLKEVKIEIQHNLGTTVADSTTYLEKKMAI